MGCQVDDDPQRLTLEFRSLENLGSSKHAHQHGRTSGLLAYLHRTSVRPHQRGGQLFKRCVVTRRCLARSDVIIEVAIRGGDAALEGHEVTAATEVAGAVVRGFY